MAKINARSPYFLTYVDQYIESAKLDLYIYTGDAVGTMDEVMYSLESDVYNGYVSFEISQLISDYIDVMFNGSFDSNTVWLNYQVTKTIGAEVLTPETPVTLPVFDGYGYFEDGARPQLSSRLLQSNDTIYSYDGNIFNFPVQQDSLDYIDLMYQGEVIGATNSSNLILYSEDVSTVWSATQLDLDLNAIVSGNYFGDRIVATNSNAPHWIEQTYTKDTTERDYTASVYVKAAEYSRMYFRISDGTNDSVILHFNTSTQAFTNVVSGTNVTTVANGYSDEGDGWYRVYMTFNSSTDTEIDVVIGIVDDNDDYIFIGDELAGVNLSGIYIRGMQLSEGALSAYTQTVSVPVSGGTFPNRIFFTPTTDSSDIIRYISYTNPKECLRTVNYLFEDRNNYLFEDANNYIFDDASAVDEIRITYTDTSTESVYIKTVSENKYTPYRLTFVNKFGALQSVWMFKRSDVSMSVKNEGYRGFLLNGSSYNVSEHQYRNYNVTARESVSLNSGFYNENYNEVFRQLLLSEKVWIDYKDQILPVNIKSKELSFKTQVDDKLIDYKIDFEFAFDKINNVF